MTIKVAIRGGGDLASGVAIRLHRAGLKVLICELEKPLAVRRSVSFAQAVYSEKVIIENIVGILVDKPDQISLVQLNNEIPVIVDPNFKIFAHYHPDVVVDARMIKQPQNNVINSNSLLIGLGPGFIAGQDCHAVVETKRGFFLGRVYWQGSAEKDTSLPEKVLNHDDSRVLRAPCDGIFQTTSEIGDTYTEGQLIGKVEDEKIEAPFRGMLRGLLHTGLEVQLGLKIGDLDPRLDKQLCEFVSDKALSVGGGVLEAILSIPGLRKRIAD
jgi:xanthine dehydrogenase accessory factor